MIPFYDDPKEESTLLLGESSEALILVSDNAMIETKLENGFDKQRKKGANFGRLRFLGVAPAEFAVSFVVFPDQEEAFFRDVKPLLRQPGKNGTAPPLDAVHPQINRFDVVSVTVMSADIGQPTARDGRYVTINLIEWTPAPVKAKDPNADRQKREPKKIDLGFAGGLRGVSNG